MERIYDAALPLANVVLMITVVFANPVALLMEFPPETEVEFEMVVICEDVVWFS